jgi:hypothetical protein
MSEERRKILQMVSDRHISPEEGAGLLKLVDAQDQAAVGDGAEGQPSTIEHAPAGGRHSHSQYWQYPLLIGLAIVALGMAVVAPAYQNERVNPATWLCGWIPLVFGLTLATIAAWSRSAHWIHLRVHTAHERLSLHLPLPLGATAAVLSAVRPFVPRLRDTAVDEVIIALRDGLQGGEDIVLEVRDDQEGERVNIDFGGRP